MKGHSPKLGAPQKIDDECVRNIAERLAAFPPCTLKSACALEWVKPESFHDYLRSHPEAQLAIECARAQSKEKLSAWLIDHVDRDSRAWKGPLELLARLYPDEYAQRKEIKMEVEHAAAPTTVVILPASPRAAAMVSALNAAALPANVIDVQPEPDDSDDD